MACMWRTFIAIYLSLGSVECVDKSKFRTFEQGSFGRRYRKYISKVEGDAGLVVHKLDPSTIKSSGNKVQASLLFANDASVKPLLLELSFFLNDVDGSGGIVRTFVTEKDPLHPRFRLTPGDVVRKDEDLQPDKVAVTEGAGFTEIASTSGACKVKLQHSPFQLEYVAHGRVLQKLNSRRFLNFERYRAKGAQAHAGLVDATDLDPNNLFEESFGGHTDSKPRGPAAVGVDVAFEDAVDVFGLAEHAVGLGLGENRLPEPYRFFNLDVFEYALDVPMALYGAIPLVTAIHREKSGETVASGFFFPNPSEGFVHVDASKGSPQT
ncbi:Ganab, partial [Symbiodinium sp. CCMP2456]